MRHIRLIIPIIIVLIFATQLGEVQGQIFDIAYGETRSEVFTRDLLDHRWIIFGGEARDMLRIRVFRIGGQFTPHLRLLDASANVLAESQGNTFSDIAELVYDAGLPDSPVYQIEVSRPDSASNDSANPPEYSLTLEYIGKRRATIDEGLTPLPDIGSEAAPELQIGVSQRLPLQIEAYGENVEVSEPVNSQYIVSSQGWELSVNQSVPIVSGVVSASFLDEGIGLTLRNEILLRDGDRTFFSDENFLISYNDVLQEYRFTLASGAVIITDFNRVESIQVRDGAVAFRMLIGDIVKRLIFNNSFIDVRQLTSGATEAALTQIQLGEGQFITTDLLGWHTLAYYDNQLRVYYGSDARLLSDTAYFSIRQNIINPLQSDLAWFESASPNARRINISLDWQEMGDLRFAEGQIFIESLASQDNSEDLAAQSIFEDLNTLDSLLLEDGAVQFTRRDNTFRSVFPDGTEIETASELSENFNLMPYEDGFRTRNYNNLGENILPLCDCIDSLEPMIPVNPANGNFFYKVNDFFFPGHQLELEFTRYYNSHAVNLTPEYMRNSSVAYPLMGDGWRHSYQYELDISSAPVGRIRFIEPDGTGHYFFPEVGNLNRWTSRTLLSMVITREGGTLGTWLGANTDGLLYYFDRVGRLSRISISSSQSITISPAPIDALGINGIFVVEPYGRRIELYEGESGWIEIARDTLTRQIRYAYNGTQLIGVEYNTNTQTANYTYNSRGLLEHFDDVRSPYFRAADIQYDVLRRVERYTENPDGDLTPSYGYRYTESEDGLSSTSRIILIDEKRRTTTWVYNNLFQLITLSLPHDNWNYEFTYDASTGTISDIRTPTLVRFSFSFDRWGNLIRFEDPFFTGEQAYNFNYEQRGNRSLLRQINYPNNRIDTFQWSDDNNPKLFRQDRLVFTGIDQTIRSTRFEYDDLERVAMVVEAGDIATLYQYDSFGYVSALWQGIELQTGETLADITNSDRAWRVVQLDYDPLGQVRSFRDGRGNTYTLTWDNNTEQLQQIRDPEGFSLNYSYDERGRISLVDDRGQVTTYLYNGLDQVVSIIDAEGALLTFDYDTARNLLTIVDDLQRQTSFSYDTLNNPIQRISPSGATSIYDTSLDLESGFAIRREIDPIGRLIEWRYDGLGRLTLYRISDDDFEQEFRIDYNSIGNPLRVEETTTGRAITFEYNFVGDVRAVIIEGSRTEFAYNERGLLAQRSSPAGQITNYSYDPLGNIISVILPEGGVWRYDYDENSNLLKATDPNNLTTQYVYNDLNQLINVEDPQGNIQGFAYDARGNLANIIDPRGISRRFEYDLLDNLILANDGQEQQTSYTYDNLGRLSKLSQPSARSIQFTHDAEDNIIAVTLNNLQRTLYSYDAIGRITSITDPLGHTTAYQYNPVGRITQIVDPIGNVEAYTWRSGTLYLDEYTSASGQVFSINTDTDALGRVTAIRDEATVSNPLNTYISYDDDGFVTGIRVGTEDARNNSTSGDDVFYQYRYDANGHPILYIDPLGGEWQLSYDNGSRLTQIINPNGVPTRYQYDDSGRITQIIHYADTSVEAIEIFEYDANDNIRAYISPDDVRNEYTYDQNNNLAQAILAVGTEIESIYQFNYNGLGRLVRVEDPLERATQYFYQLDNLNRVLRTLGEEDLVDIRYDFDRANNLSNIELRRGTNSTNAIQISLSYDALNRRVRYVNSEDKSWSYTYDAAGNITQISDPLGSAVAYTYDNYDRVISIHYPSGSTVSISYDSAGNLSAVTLPPNADGTSQRVRYTLDPLGNITAMQIGNNTTRFEYDALGNVTTRIAPDGRRTNYEYDAAERLISASYNDGKAIEYEYDDRGNLLRVDDTAFEYDALGRMTSTTENGLNLNYIYDDVGNVLERSAGEFGVTRYAYDALNRPIQIEFNGDQLLLEYNEINQITSIQRSNGVRTSIGYDSAGRPINIAHLSDARLDGFEYQYDAVGNLIRVGRIDSSSILYSYDVDHRLIGERWLNNNGETAYSVSFRYDEVGNRSEELRNGRLTTFSYDGQNRLIREVRNIASQEGMFLWLPTFSLGVAMIFVMRRRRRWWLLPSILLFVGVVFAQTSAPQVTVDYTYDANGNLVEVSYANVDETFELQLAYDAENRLIALNGQGENGQDVDTELQYDQFSRLVNWRSGETEYSMFYDGHTPLGMSDGESFQQFLYVDEQRILTQISNLGSLWHLNDQIGSTRRYTDSEGQLIEDPSRVLEFGSFGVRIFPYADDGISPEGADLSEPIPFFGGQLYDPSTGLYLIGLRAYDPMTGRFLQADPIRQDPIGTLYTYARNRPFVFGDPTGMMVSPFVDPLDAAILGDEIRPESVIPRPTLPDFPLPPAVHRLQADDTFRAFQLLETLRYGTNTVVGQLSPLRDDFYLFDFNPIPDVMRQQSTQPLQRVMNIYETGDAWRPNPRPNPTIAHNPFDQIREIEPLLNQAYIQPLVWNNTRVVATQIVPSLVVPQGLDTSWQLEATLTRILQPISLMTALVPESTYLLDLNRFTGVPQIPQPTVLLPSAPVEPATLSNLDALRLQTFEFNSRIWSINGDDCEFCVTPLGFSR